MRGALVSMLLLAGCTDGSRPEVGTFPAPGKLRQALSSITAVEASAELVPEGGAPLAPVALTPGEDAISFTGFLAAGPGTYRLEISFSGVLAGESERSFLGRWASDTFTVAEGDTVSPTFSLPLDTIGRPDDRGDLDADGLGLLDEFLWGADRGAQDSDADGLRDGDDCDPIDPARIFTVAGAGTIEDCDGDGALRMDIPYRAGGTDCNDRDPSLQVCPIDDRDAPSIAILDPMPGETVGCHRRIRATMMDPSGIAEQNALFLSASGVIEAVIPMRPDGAQQYITNQYDIATNYWLEDGVQRFAVRGVDGRGNTSTVTAQLTFALEVPVVSMTPPVIGRIELPLDVRVEASSSHGLASIALMRAPWPTGGNVDRATEVEIARASESPALLRIDPATLPDGRYAIYAIVTDSIGNQNKPALSFDPEDGATDADFLCIFESGEANVPVRELIIGEVQIPPGNEPAKMKDHLDEAVALAAARDPNARLVQIRGWGIQPDGFIPLDQDAGGEGKWWRYEFLNAAETRHIQITWYTANYAIQNPEVEVDEDYPFTSEPIMAAPGDLLDSDLAVTAYLNAGCPALAGSMDDSVRWESDLPFTNNDIIRFSVGDVDWKATATAPITEIWACP